MSNAKTKFLTVFISAFLCFNLGGSACLAYCGIVSAQMSGDHCPPAKMEAKHCQTEANNEEKSPEKSLSGNEIDCCTLALNPVFANLEQHQKFQNSAAVLPDKHAPPKFEFSVKTTKFVAVHYQKPFYDRRAERLKHCVFLI